MSRAPRRLLLIAATLLLAPAAVAAASTVPTRPTTTATPTIPPAHVAGGSMKLYLPDAFFVYRAPVTIPGRGVRVDGVVSPYVAGQWVTVRVYLGRRLIKTDHLRIKPSAKHTYGKFSERIVARGVGSVNVKVTHAATTTQAGFNASRSYSTLNPNIGFGSTGRFVVLMQQRLAALHLYIRQTGVYDSSMGWALDAYHRLLHWGTYQSLDRATITWLLNGWGSFGVRFPHQGRHAEGNLGLQLLALISGSKVQYVFPISSGKPSTPTILGSFRVYSRVPGYLPDGMYFSSFFIGGYAIHGYDPAPDYPASHGCMRLPIADAIFAYNWLTYGDWVDTYY